ncbi:MAG: hypothetical protein AYK18_07455 [Theionarchaea archaeon DG-70]|nr:MAG: hypothetical protein AYK18_07455 [Theionarchaea archaeon DG-70]
MFRNFLSCMDLTVDTSMVSISGFQYFMALELQDRYIMFVLLFTHSSWYFHLKPCISLKYMYKRDSG